MNDDQKDPGILSELRAMNEINLVLSALTPSEVNRILSWLSQKYGQSFLIVRGLLGPMSDEHLRMKAPRKEF